MTQRSLCAATAALALLAAAPTPALAWGDEGHMIIATLAWSRMSPAVQAKVTALLGAEHDTLTAGDFVSRATWADRFRDSDRPPEGVSPTPANNPRYLGTRNWHFVDLALAGPVPTTAAFDAAC